MNWDFPNTWPPHLYTAIKTFETLWRVNPNASVIEDITIPFDDKVGAQIGMKSEGDLRPQPADTVGNVSLSTDVAPTKPWPMALAIEYGNRYVQAAFCSWYSTGGSIDGVLEQLPLSDLNATGTYVAGEAGVMFEKVSPTLLGSIYNYNTHPSSTSPTPTQQVAEANTPSRLVSAGPTASHSGSHQSMASGSPRPPALSSRSWPSASMARRAARPRRSRLLLQRRVRQATPPCSPSPRSCSRDPGLGAETPPAFTRNIGEKEKM